MSVMSYFMHNIYQRIILCFSFWHDFENENWIEMRNSLLSPTWIQVTASPHRNMADLAGLRSLMRLQQFPFDLWLPLSCQFTLWAWHPPILSANPCRHLHFTSPSCAITFSATHHWHNSLTGKISRVRVLEQVLLQMWLLVACKCFLMLYLLIFHWFSALPHIRPIFDLGSDAEWMH